MFLYFYSYSELDTKILDFNLFLIENVDESKNYDAHRYIDTKEFVCVIKSPCSTIMYICIIVFTILSKSVKKRTKIQVTVQNTKPIQM